MSCLYNIASFLFLRFSLTDTLIAHIPDLHFALCNQPTTNQQAAVKNEHVKMPHYTDINMFCPTWLKNGMGLYSSPELGKAHSLFF